MTLARWRASSGVLLSRPVRRSSRLWLGFLFGAAACHRVHGSVRASDSGISPPVASARSGPRAPCTPAPHYAPSPVEREHDEIYSLLAYSVALADWQDGPRQRGYNVAAVLVGPTDEPVCWARNATNALQDETRHAEVILITTYLREAHVRNLNGYSLYSTLEPCAMCAGMILMTHAKKVIYGSHAGASASAFERLQFDSTSVGGYCPYPWPLVVGAAPVETGAELDAAHAQRVANFYYSDAAKQIFESAHQRLTTFHVEHPENAPVLQRALAFLGTATNDASRDKSVGACPPVVAPVSR
jgi:tRNA(adenine34) deaminase